MMYKVETINGVNVAVPITADVGSGVPVGTIIAQYKKTSMTGYLYLDGRDTTGTADELQTVYPALYSYLGNTNVLPDYREFALVGAEQNTTSSNIATHDTYTQGQEKDDQVQTHQHYIAGSWSSGTNLKCYNGQTNLAGGGGSYGVINTSGSENALAVRNAGGRQGDVTRGKRKAVYFYMKATVGVTEGTVTEKIEAGNYNPVSSNAVSEWALKKVTNLITGTRNSQATTITFSNIVLPTNSAKYFKLYVIMGNWQIGLAEGSIGNSEGSLNATVAYKTSPLTITYSNNNLVVTSSSGAYLGKLILLDLDEYLYSA